MRTLLLPTCLAALAAACGSSSTGPDNGGGNANTGQLVVKASGSASAALLDGGQLNVSPSFFEIGFVEMRIIANPDCSGSSETIFTHSTPSRVDIIPSPEIARATGVPNGSYDCVAMRVSDLLRYQPATTEGDCVAGVTTEHDVYRVDNEPTPYKDLAGAAITPHGTDATPSEDLIWVFASTNPSAVVARGYSENQVIPLSSALVVPGTTTFYWDLTNGLSGIGQGFCETVGGTIGFR